MNVQSVSPIVPPLLAMQFFAFGWRINREIPLGDEGRRMWFPLPDIVNIVSMLSVVVFAVVLPLGKNPFPKLSWVVVGVAYLFLAFHPITMAAHYRLWSREGRAIYKKQGKDFPYATRQEKVVFTVSLGLAALTTWWLWR